MTTETLIQPTRMARSLQLGELWRHRELLRLFVWRAISARYRQMALGAVWALLEPLAMLLMMIVVFGVLLRLPTDGYPYPVFAYAALMPWLLFSKATLGAVESLKENINVISKVYFPRIILPISAVVKELFDAGITLVLLILVAWWYGFTPGINLLALPVLMLVTMLLALGIGLWLCVVTVKYRDVRYIVALTLQMGMYLTPIIYAPSIVPEQFLAIYQLNPMYWVVTGFRWALLGQAFEVTQSLYGAMAIVCVLLVGGIFTFSRLERLAVDIQ